MKKYLLIALLLSLIVGCSNSHSIIQEGTEKTTDKQSIASNKENIEDNDSDKKETILTNDNQNEKSSSSMESSLKSEKQEDSNTTINVPETYFLQVPQYVQEKSYYCSVAALQSVMAYHGIYASQDELAKELKTDSITGTEYEDLARVATERICSSGNGKYISVIPSSDSERELFEQRMMQNIKMTEPVFVSINNRLMYEDVPDQVHQIVVVGMTIENGKVISVRFLDPSYTRQDLVYGGLKACTGDELWKAMIDNKEPGYVFFQPGLTSESDQRVEANPPVQLDTYMIPITQSIQENNYYNGPACVQMVLRLHGIEKSQPELAKEMNTSSSTGTEYENIQRVVNKYVFGKENISDNEFGYHLQLGIETNLLEERIMADMESKDPVFIALDGNTLYEGKSKGNHLVLIVGYSKFKETNIIANYYFIDPWEQDQDATYGVLKIVTPEDLIKSLISNSEPAYIW